MKDCFHKMFTGYKTLFFKICTFLFIFGICLFFSFLIVYPLWLLATSHTKTYTIISLTFFSAFVLVVIGKAAIKRYRQNSRMFFHSLIKKLILLTGFAGFFILIFAYQRFFAFLSLIVALILYGFVAFGLSEK